MIVYIREGPHSHLNLNPDLKPNLNDISLRGGGGGNFIPQVMWNQLLEGLLLSNPFPSLLDRIGKEGSSLWPPPTDSVKEQLIKLSKVQIGLGLTSSSCVAKKH